MIAAIKSLRTCVVFASLTFVFNTGSAKADEPFDYFRNSWNVIGLKDYQHGTRVTPDNKLQLSGAREAQIRFGHELVPLGKKQVKTLVDGWLPIILVSASDGPVRYEFKLWATPLPTVSDWKAAYDWPHETENFLNWITVRATNNGQERAKATFQVDIGGTESTQLANSRWQLAPGESADAVVRIPFEPVEGESAFGEEKVETWLQRTIDYWHGLMADAARIEVPCRKSSEALLAAHVCQLIANDHGELQGGEGFYDNFYIRDGGYQIMELEEAGLWDASKKAVAHYLSRQREDGRFETQKTQFDANGQAIWVLWQYYKITGNREWLEQAYPQMRRAVDWTMKLRRQAPADSPYVGLLPAAPADGEYLWDGKHHIVGYELWNLRGILCTADAADALGRAEEARELCKEAELYREAIDAACQRTGLAHFPPSWEKEGTHWGNTETLWPTPVVAADDPRVITTIDHARHVHGDGFIEGTIQWLGRSPAIHPYMSAYTTMASLHRGEHEQVVEDFYWYLLHSTAAHAFPEGIFQARRFAWSNTIPHVTGASNYALMLRHMLVDERGDELHLLAAVPDWWLDDGQTITVERAPTHFGEISLTVCGTADGVKVDFKPPTREQPKRIVLYVPKSRPLTGSLEGVDVVVRSDQKQRWNFPAVVKLYQETAGPAARPIPGLAEFPLAARPNPDRCVVVKTNAIANTDPFTAPFGVPNPGKFLFTGLKIGDQTVQGIPFHIIAPDANEGRSFVVLHSPRGPTNIKWPKEVKVTVCDKGKRLFFLGNVHGWSSHDPGTGPWGAVAEYEIVYANGEKQVVPLVTGRTIDEWAASPVADEVLVGLRGTPWHLNILGVKLRDVEIKEVIFRDLGTQAAPVLAAITLEKE